jgi:Arc/MetJ-type ribon-helix-helix transcriptional regulator
MKTLKVEVPDQLAKQIEHLVETGWFVRASRR